MSAVYSPKTLAKTLATMAYHSPGEYGLFWDADGTMPWKELYWALQEDASLRFVRESHLKEIAYLGIDFPALLEGKVLRLKPGLPPPRYSTAENPPRRLYYGCPMRRLPVVRDEGLRPTGRTLLPLFAEKEMALRVARRRDPDPVMIEVRTEKAVEDSVAILAAGGPLYLTSGLPASALVLPLIREPAASKSNEGKKEKGVRKTPSADSPGSFLVTPAHLQTAVPGHATKQTGAGERKKRHRGAEWKRESRKERSKRDV